MLSRRQVADIGKRTAGFVSIHLDKVLGSRANGSFGILMYHRIANKEPSASRPTWNVTPQKFREQLTKLLELSFEIWPLSKIINHTNTEKSIPEKVTTITFDDGYENFFTEAFPVLKEFNIPATVFISTAYTNSKKPFTFDSWSLQNYKKVSPKSWKPLDWSQCQELLSSGLVEIGSHSHSHLDFRNSVENFEEDIKTSLAILKDELKIESCPFSFPFGSKDLGFATGSFNQILKSYSVTCALTTDIELNKPSTSPFGWGRLEVTDYDNAESIIAKLDGWYNWVRYSRKLFRKISKPKVINTEIK
jgi:peptidoglycan/xylan/chitin deacetylase (PgdA/CDA1 family)